MYMKSSRNYNMATIDDKRIIDDIIKNHGYYEYDPRVSQIVEYTNQFGKVTWGVTWSNELPIRQIRYEQETQYVRNPKVIWKAK